MKMDNKTKVIIGYRIATALIDADKNQKKLAEHLGIPDNTVSYWCAGKRTPNTEQIIEISKFLNVSSDYLLGLSEHSTLNLKESEIADYIGCSTKSLQCIHNNIFNISDDVKELIEDDVETQAQYILSRAVHNCFFENYEDTSYNGVFDLFVIACIRKAFYFSDTENSKAQNESFAEVIEYKLIKQISRDIENTAKNFLKNYEFCGDAVIDKKTKEAIYSSEADISYFWDTNYDDKIRAEILDSHWTTEGLGKIFYNRGEIENAEEETQS